MGGVLQSTPAAPLTFIPEINMGSRFFGVKVYLNATIDLYGNRMQLVPGGSCSLCFMDNGDQ